MRNWIILAITLCVLTPELYADPPTRVARIQQVQGEMSFLPVGAQEWVRAARNRPLIRGDSLWNDRNTKSIAQLDNTAIGLGANTNLNILELNDNLAQFQLTQGTVNLYIKRIHTDQRVSIATPNLAFTVNQPGYYRVKVSADGLATTVTVREGAGQIDGPKQSYRITKNQSFQFVGKILGRPQILLIQSKDSLDKWFDLQAVRKKSAASVRYVSSEMVGYEDLDRYGKWVVIKEYGHVWTPTKVATNWAPYRFGHWNWVEPWGWTWIGDEPWGFAPYHYGRWVYAQHHWYWIPVAAKARPVYAPALVAFIGGARTVKSSAPANVTWFPLAPGEIYRPTYKVSQTYFTNVNTTNTTINQTIINQAYQQPAAPTTYRNLQAPNAVTAVPQATFVNAKPVEKALVKIAPQQATALQVIEAAPVVNERPAVDTNAVAAVKPTEQVLTREVVVQTPAQAKENPPAIPITEGPAEKNSPAVEQSAPKALAPDSKVEHTEAPIPKEEPVPVSEPKHSKPVRQEPTQVAPEQAELRPEPPIRSERAQPEPQISEPPIQEPTHSEVRRPKRIEPEPQHQEPVPEERVRPAPREQESMPQRPEPPAPQPESIRHEPVQPEPVHHPEPKPKHEEPAPKIEEPPAPTPEPIAEPAPAPLEEVKPEEKPIDPSAPN